MHSEDPHLNAHEPAEEVKLFDRRSFLKAGAHAAVAVAAAGVAAQPLMGVSDPPSPSEFLQDHYKRLTPEMMDEILKRIESDIERVYVRFPRLKERMAARPRASRQPRCSRHHRCRHRYHRQQRWNNHRHHRFRCHHGDQRPGCHEAFCLACGDVPAPHQQHRHVVKAQHHGIGEAHEPSVSTGVAQLLIKLVGFIARL